MDLKQLKADLTETPYIGVAYYEAVHLLNETSGPIVNYIDLHGINDCYEDRLMAKVDTTCGWVSIFSDGKMYHTPVDHNGIIQQEVFLGEVKDWVVHAV